MGAVWVQGGCRVLISGHRMGAGWVQGAYRWTQGGCMGRDMRDRAKLGL